jgi:tRNA pseudouridine55 synthase
MDGLLIIDKPAGPTSHDVVARMRRVLRERRIGHTGTLDPLATGVLPLVVGRATRLARFLSGSDKTYEAVVRLGIMTDTGDREGAPTGEPYVGPMPARDVVERALDSFRGAFVQQPPLFSAKKIGGQRSYDLARRSQTVTRQSDSFAGPPPPSPISVTVHALDLLTMDAGAVTLRMTVSAGFYVRALARDLGERLGTGGHLAALRRTQAGELTLDQAVALEAAERDPAAAAARVVPLSGMLTHLPALTLDSDAVRRTIQGRDLESRIPNPESRLVRLLDEGGDLVAVAEPSAEGAGLLHPSVVLK